MVTGAQRWSPTGGPVPAAHLRTPEDLRLHACSTPPLAAPRGPVVAVAADSLGVARGAGGRCGPGGGHDGQRRRRDHLEPPSRRGLLRGRRRKCRCLDRLLGGRSDQRVRRRIGNVGGPCRSRLVPGARFDRRDRRCGPRGRRDHPGLAGPAGRRPGPARAPSGRGAHPAAGLDRLPPCGRRVRLQPALVAPGRHRQDRVEPRPVRRGALRRHGGGPAADLRPSHGLRPGDGPHAVHPSDVGRVRHGRQR
jgi:hypothetical protein